MILHHTIPLSVQKYKFKHYLKHIYPKKSPILTAEGFLISNYLLGQFGISGQAPVFGQDQSNTKHSKLVMIKKGEHIEGTPAELQVLLNQNAEANEFFASLSKSYKQGYCDWVGSAKQEDTLKLRVDKAMIMLRKKEKTLTT